GGEKSADLGLAVMLEQDDSWRKWTGNTRMLLSTKRQGEGQAFNVSLHDAIACNCQPSDAAGAKQAYGSWSKQQEQRWTLTSAIEQYRELFKHWPNKLEDMVRPYPNNVLSGETSLMRKLFPDILQRQKAAAAARGDSAGNGSGGAESNG
ncbi:hypothetical protein K0U00_48045, partial [Paenibacillus sepulcri]|nr:hypothetical protein [Paenibacillus sepulcri]